jgi:hypothetical protein
MFGVAAITLLCAHPASGLPPFLIFPVALATAYRLGARGAAMASLVVAVIALPIAMAGGSPRFNAILGPIAQARDHPGVHPGAVLHLPGGGPGPGPAGPPQASPPAPRAADPRRPWPRHGRHRGQDRVPGHDEPRDPHATEQRARLRPALGHARRPAARRPPAGQSDRQRRRGPADRGQRHPRFLAGRGRPDRALAPADLGRRLDARHRGDHGAGSPRQGPDPGPGNRRSGRRPARPGRRPPAPGADQTCSTTP